MSSEKSYKMYGWFSKKQMKISQKFKCTNTNIKNVPKYNIYLTNDNREVTVTMVSKSCNKNDFNFDDIEYKGEVIKWLRAVF